MKDYVAENERILEKWRKRNEERGEKNFADDGIMNKGDFYLDKDYDNNYFDHYNNGCFPYIYHKKHIL